MTRKRAKTNPKADAIYDFIVGYIHKHKVAPSTREIADAFATNKVDGNGEWVRRPMSTSVVMWYVNRLVFDGRLTKQPGRSRAIALVDPEVESRRSFRERVAFVLEPFAIASTQGRSAITIQDLWDAKQLYEEIEGPKDFENMHYNPIHQKVPA